MWSCPQKFSSNRSEHDQQIWKHSLKLGFCQFFKRVWLKGARGILIEGAKPRHPSHVSFTTAEGPGPALSSLGPGVKQKIRGPSTYMLVIILYVRACLVHVRAMRCTLNATFLAHFDSRPNLSRDHGSVVQFLRLISLKVRRRNHTPHFCRRPCCSLAHRCRPNRF